MIELALAFYLGGAFCQLASSVSFAQMLGLDFKRIFLATVFWPATSIAGAFYVSSEVRSAAERLKRPVEPPPPVYTLGLPGEKPRKTQLILDENLESKVVYFSDERCDKCGQHLPIDLPPAP